MRGMLRRAATRCLSSTGKRGEFMSIKGDDGDHHQSMRDHREALSRLEGKFERTTGKEKWKLLRWFRTGRWSSRIVEEWILTTPQFRELRDLPITFGKVEPSPDCSVLTIPYSYDKPIEDATYKKLDKVINDRYGKTIRMLIQREMQFKYAPLVRFKPIPKGSNFFRTQQ
eukprot:TRINITY_DN13983_c0_g1_i1.p1 TRINITY_DN13983_c0_g1~~TRINITY_DN13983_c0_g1_i1.p1  ORF type:complete len:170 (-),score=26.14 TRINITY_DN13983_c0_g1_i1:49-558(-)